MYKRTLNKISDFASVANGQGIEGAIQAAIEATVDGGTVIFDSSDALIEQKLDFAIFSPVLINKSISLIGEKAGIKIVNRTRQSPCFIVDSSQNVVHFDFINFEVISGTVGLVITGTHPYSQMSELRHLIFKHQTEKAVQISSPEVGFHFKNVWISGSPQYGIHILSDSSRDILTVDNVCVEGATIAGLYYSKNSLGTGPVFMQNSFFHDNNQAIVVNNVRYYEHNIEYADNNANYVLSGTSVRITGSGGGGGGGGVTDHGALTGLLDDDHTQYVKANGTRPMSGNLDMGGFSITNVVNVDGINLETLDATIDAHILDTNNPHATSIANIDPGTLAQLNTAISDDNVVGESVFNPLTSSFAAISASYISTSSSFRNDLISLTNSVVRLDNSSGTFRAELNSQTASITRLDSASGTFRLELNSLTSSVVRLDSASGTFRTELNSQTASISRMDAASGTFRSELNSQTSSIGLLFGASSSFAGVSASYVTHASRHLSGGVDPIDAQSLRANGISKDRVLISDGLGGWTTVLSSAFGGGSGGPHAETHHSGGSDPVDAQFLRANGVPANHLLITHVSGGFTTKLSSSFGFIIESDFSSFSSSITASIVLLNAASASYRTELNSLTNSVVRLDAASASFRSELNSQTASIVRLDSASGTFRTAIASQTASITRIDAASASFRTELNSQTASITRIDAASASFRLELNSQTASIVRLDAASASFRTELNSQTSSITSLFGASSSFAVHASRHLSGGADPIDAQNLRGNALGANLLLISNGLGGWTTVISTSVGAPPGAPGLHATTHHSGGTDPIDAQYLRADGIAANRILLSHASGGFITVATASLGLVVDSDLRSFSSSITSSVDRLLAASASYDALSRSYYPVSASYNTLSATYYPVSASYNILSSTYYPVSRSFDAVSASFIGFSGSHASRHLSGGADPIDVQSLRANAIAIDRLLISNGLGGWTTVASSSIKTQPGEHASTHYSGATDPIDAYNLRANGVGANQIMITHTTGGFVMVATASLGFVVRSDLTPFSTSITSSVDKLLAMSTSYDILSRSYYPVSASYNTLSASYYAVSASYNTLSATYYPVSRSFDTISGSYIAVSAAYNRTSASFIGMSASYDTLSRSYYPVSASYNILSASFIGFSGSHASRHLSGGADPIDAQSLRGNALGANLLLISNGLGGWTTVASQSVGTPPGAPGAHASSHLSGGSDQISAQNLAANGLGANLLLITNANGGWTTVASQSVGGSGPGGGITNVMSATTEGRSLVSGVFGGIAYIKTIKSLTSSVDNIRLSDTSPVLLSSSDDTVYITRRPSSRAQYFFDDFIGAVTTAAGFGWTFAAGGTGGSIQVDNVDNTNNRASYMGSAVGVISMDTGTTAAGGVVLQGGANSFALRHMSASSIEWRLMVSGATDTSTQVLRVQFGWLDTPATGTRRPTNGLYFEMTASNFGSWNIVSSSGSVHTVYNSAVQINSQSFANYKIETVNFPPTASFYINDVLIGSISSTMPFSLKPFGPMVKISKEIGTSQRDLFVDYCEIFYECVRE